MMWTGKGIDRERREICVSLLDDYLDGRIDSWGLGFSWPRSRKEPALEELPVWISAALEPSKMMSRWLAETGQSARELLERCKAFLRSELPYRWPRYANPISPYFVVPVVCVFSLLAIIPLIFVIGLWALSEPLVTAILLVTIYSKIGIRAVKRFGNLGHWPFASWDEYHAVVDHP